MKNKTEEYFKTKNREYRDRIKLAVNTIFELTNDKTFDQGFYRFRKNQLFARCGTVLMNLGFVENRGSATKPSYSWSAGKASPDKKLYKSVYKILENKFTHKILKTKDEIDVAVSTMKDTEVPQLPSVFALVNFTDQQLWDELKSRGYSIKDNRLTKTIYLQ